MNDINSSTSSTYNTTAPNPTSAILWFFIITTGFFTIKYFIGGEKNDPDKSKQNIFMGIYILLIIIGEYFINLNLTKTMCGTNQWGTAIIVTIIPWVIIFGLLNVMLIVFPGWLSPFSNTFGYGIARLAGLNKLVNDIFEVKTSDTSSKEMKEMQEALAHIYSNKSLLINEITQNNFDSFWNKMSVVFKKGVVNNSILKEKLRDMVRLKDLVAQYIWYMLTGILVTSVGYNYTVNVGCQQSVQEMQKRHNEYEEEMIKNTKEKENAPPARTYTLYE